MLAGLLCGVKLILIIICAGVAIAIALFIPYFIITSIYIAPYLWKTCDKQEFQGVKKSVKEATKMYKSWFKKEPTESVSSFV